MLTTPTFSPPDPTAAQGAGPSRPPRQAQDAPEPRRFAELLQRRRDAQPAAQPPQPQPQREANPQPKADSAAKPTARGPADGDERASASDAGAARGDADPAGREAPRAASGCAASERPGAGKAPAEPGRNPRDRPIVELPMQPPTDATETAAPRAAPATDGATHDAKDDSKRDAAAPALASVDPALWPGMLPVAADAAATARTASAAGGGGAPDLRIGSGAATAGNAAAGLALAGGAAGDAGRSGAGRQGAAGEDSAAAADRAAALLAAAASDRAPGAAATVPAERFALVPRAPDAALAQWAGVHAPQRGDAGAPAQAALPTPLASPDFARALGAQVSVFARNGLAHAELQLTPAEMGPIRVQIAIDGAHARIDFAADSPTTRQVIERGLPELASALREQGLTLAGGGVFQRAPDQSGENEASDKDRAVGRAKRRAVVAAEAAEPARAARTAARPGGVDLYA